LGLSVSIIIFTWVIDEISYNKIHTHAEQIYLIRSWYKLGDHSELGSGSPPALGPAIKEECPEILYSSRIYNGTPSFVFRYDTITLKEDFLLSDPDLFKIFTLPFKYGNPDLTLQNDQVLVLSEKVAEKYFGDRNPIGESVIIDNKYDFTVAGVIEDIPHNSTIQFDAWIPIQFTKKTTRENFIDTWYNLAFQTYILVNPDTEIKTLRNYIEERILKSDPETKITATLYPFKQLYLLLYGKLGGVIILSSIAILILFIACINYINLTSAKSTKRCHEVGIKKIVGASRKQLVIQFLGESLIIAIISLIISLITIELVLPYFNELLNKELRIDINKNANTLLTILFFVIIVGILAGLYPAIVISKTRPSDIIKTQSKNIKKHANFRKGLIVFQFNLSIILFILTIFIFRQLNYMEKKELGIDKEHLVYLPLEGDIDKKPVQFKNDILKYADFKSATLVSSLPTGIYWNGEGWNWLGKDQSLDPLVTYLFTDDSFLETFNIRLNDGRYFNGEYSNNIVINKTFANIIDTSSVLEKVLWQGKINSEEVEQHLVIGVVDDFHFKPLDRNIEPIILFNDSKTSRYNYIVIKINNDDVSESIELLEKLYKGYNPYYPFEIHFLDDDYDKLYTSVKKFNSLIAIFTILGIFISCLGLFGLASYLTELRTKEIGIRKANGAITIQIILLLSKFFTRWVLLGFIFAVPISYLFAAIWLQEFAYKTPLSWWVFALAGFVALLISWITVSFQTIKAARKNPVEALRYE
jgi:ABC-type antimicrobial peptide transport system permease subunit